MFVVYFWLVFFSICKFSWMNSWHFLLFHEHVFAFDYNQQNDSRSTETITSSSTSKVYCYIFVWGKITENSVVFIELWKPGNWSFMALTCCLLNTSIEREYVTSLSSSINDRKHSCNSKRRWWIILTKLCL